MLMNMMPPQNQMMGPQAAPMGAPQPGRPVINQDLMASEHDKARVQLDKLEEVAEKQRVVEMLWQVALADSRLDRHEDHLVRRIAELLYVPHSDLIRIRNRVRSTR